MYVFSFPFKHSLRIAIYLTPILYILIMKNVDIFCIDNENKEYLQKNFLGKKSAIVNMLITKFVETDKNNPDLEGLRRGVPR